MRTTGATDAQIEAALDAWCSMNDFRPAQRSSYELDAEQWAAALVPPTHCIALRDDLRALCRKAQESPRPTRESEALIDRITALLE